MQTLNREEKPYFDFDAVQLQGISSFSAALTPPPSKSQTMRALLFAFLAKGDSLILNPLISPDTLAMAEAIEILGAQVRLCKTEIAVTGIGGNFSKLDEKKTLKIDAKNSGIILRFIGAILGLFKAKSTITGDRSIQENRIIQPLISGLRILGASVESIKQNERPPLTIQGPIFPGKIVLDGQDSQPVSAFLIALSFLKGSSEIFVENANEKPWIDLTLSWLDFLKIPYQRKDYSYFKLQGNAKIEGFTYQVPADFSSLAYPLALAVLTNSRLKMENLKFQDRQNDKILIDILQKMGAGITYSVEKGFLSVKNRTLPLQGLKIDAGHLIDQVPLIAVIGCFAQSKTQIHNAFSCRFKESDRLKTIHLELKKMGARIEEKKDGLIIYPSNLKGSNLLSHQDHRIALSLAVAALSIPTASTLWGVKSILKTYPSFFSELQKLGQHIQPIKNKKPNFRKNVKTI